MNESSASIPATCSGLPLIALGAAVGILVFLGLRQAVPADLPPAGDPDLRRPQAPAGGRHRRRLPGGVRRPGLARADHRDGRSHGHAGHPHRRAGAGRLHPGGHPAQGAGHRGGEDLLQPAGGDERGRAFPGAGPADDPAGGQGDPGGQPARGAGHLDPRGGERGPAEVRRVAGAGGGARSGQAGAAPRRAEDPARHRRRQLPGFDRPRTDRPGHPARPRSPSPTPATRRPRRPPAPRCAPRWPRPTPNG